MQNNGFKFKQKPPREDNLSTKDKWPVPKLSSLRRFYCTCIFVGRANDQSQEVDRLNINGGMHMIQNYLFGLMFIDSANIYCYTKCVLPLLNSLFKLITAILCCVIHVMQNKLVL